MNGKKILAAALLFSMLSACSSLIEQMAEQNKAEALQKAEYDKAVVGFVGDYLVVAGRGFDDGFTFAASYVQAKAKLVDGQLTIILQDKKQREWQLSGHHCQGSRVTDYKEQEVQCFTTIFHQSGIGSEFGMTKAAIDRTIPTDAMIEKEAPLPVKKGEFTLWVSRLQGGRKTYFKLIRT